MTLTKKENLLETIRGGRPDRFVDQFSYMEFAGNPIRSNVGCFIEEGEEGCDGWGVKYIYPRGTPGTFPDCEGENKLLKDVTQWKEVIRAPRLLYSAEEWAPYVETAKTIDRNEVFCATWIAPGIFERLHSFMGMEDTMINFYEEPEAMHELIDFLAQWEVDYASEVVRYLHPEAVFHHDDWGSQRSSFFSPEMFSEFLEPAYQKIYGFWKENGVQIIVHHSDSYAANLVPAMIRMGIDIWQGPVTENDIPAVLRQYGPQITLMGGLNNGIYDTEDWSREKIQSGLKRLVEDCGNRYLIPALTMGGPESIYEGVYDAVSQEVNRLSREYF